MTPQEIFDTVAKHLITQGKQSADDIGTCLYRGPGGLKCAVGVLIPDEMYTPSMEMADNGVSDNGISNLVTQPGIELPAYFQDNIALLQRLQYAHDKCSYCDKHDFARELGIIAAEFALDPAVVAPLIIEYVKEES